VGGQCLAGGAGGGWTTVRIAYRVFLGEFCLLALSPTKGVVMAANSTTTTRFASGPGICTMHKAQCPQVGKYFYGVFEPPLPRNAQKRTKKKSQGKKKSDGGRVGLRFIRNGASPL
jgi:hypothetical protein